VRTDGTRASSEGRLGVRCSRVANGFGSDSRRLRPGSFRPGVLLTASRLEPDECDPESGELSEVATETLTQVSAGSRLEKMESVYLHRNPGRVLFRAASGLSERGRRGTTSRVVANSSPRQTHERRVLHEGASFALCAGISRGGPGRAVAACLGVLTAGSPEHPRWPTGWAESLSGSLRGRVPG